MLTCSAQPLHRNSNFIRPVHLGGIFSNFEEHKWSRKVFQCSKNLIKLVCLDVVDRYQWAVCRLTFTQASTPGSRCSIFLTLCYVADMKCLSNPLDLSQMAIRYGWNSFKRKHLGNRRPFQNETSLCTLHSKSTNEVLLLSVHSRFSCFSEKLSPISAWSRAAVASQQ